MNTQRISQTLTAPDSAADTYGEAIETDLARTFSIQVTPVTALGTIVGALVVDVSNDATNWVQLLTIDVNDTEPTSIQTEQVYGAFIRVGLEISANDTETEFTVNVMLKD